MYCNNYSKTREVGGESSATHAAKIIDSVTGKVVDTLYFRVSPYVSQNSIIRIIREKYEKYCDNGYVIKTNIVNH